MLTASVFIDPFLCFSQGVPIGFISSAENAARPNIHSLKIIKSLIVDDAIDGTVEGPKAKRNLWR